MADLRNPLQVERARELFFAQQRDPDEWIAPHIVRSWKRSAPVLHDTADPAPIASGLLQDRRAQAMRLLQCAQPELDGLAEHAIGNGCVVILTDASGMILDEIGSPEFLPKAERIALAPGIEWSEGSRGTNAIGTALAEREALMVLGGEHYLSRNGGLGCAAAPIFDGRGGVTGVLDISGETLRVNPHALGLVRMAAQQVGHRTMLSEASGHLLRFHRRPSLLGSAREGLLVIDDGRIVAANPVALELFGASWAELLDRSIEPLLGIGWSRLERQRGLLTLPGGQQIASVMERAAKAPALAHAAGRTLRHAAPAALQTPAPAALQTPAPAALGTPPPAVDEIQPLLDRALRVLHAGVPVLVTGETGTGKEVFARRLHAASQRRNKPFVAVNCAALPETLIEAELFGYEDGAFTGARRRGRPGRLRDADGGVLLLDEIGDMPLSLQTRLLRVLEEREVTPLGASQAFKVDFSLVCATHEDLGALVEAGRFRADLFYRVAGYVLALPPLRERSDRAALIQRLFDECGGAASRLRLHPDALACLAAYRWPGNVRELRSSVQTLAALAEPGQLISVETLPAHLTAPSRPRAAAPPVNDAAEPAPCVAAPPATLARDAIERALEASGRNITEAARRLGVHRSTLYRHLARG
ncbi:MAG TPA: sigma-54-dependent Fis family transcriptional regulator [Burkholderiaceae bacterium]|jgi:transcriptional regulator of acetoin/glycerol metabolism